MRLSLLLLLPLAACGAPNGPPLVSTQSPPGTGLVNVHAPAQTANSLPPGAANLGTAPGATSPSYGSLTLRVF